MSRLTKPLLFASPVECEQAFYDALEAADAEALCELWLDDDDVVCEPVKNFRQRACHVGMRRR